MAIKNGFRAGAANSIYLGGYTREGRGSFLFFDVQGSTDPLDDSGVRGIFVDSSNRLSYWNGTSTTRLTGGGSGATPTWEDIYSVDSTFALSNTWTLTQGGAFALLTLNKTNVGAGAVIAITNSGSGVDISNGTSWTIAASGGVGVLELASGGTINASSGALSIGSSGTTTTFGGSVTMTVGTLTLTNGGLTMTSGNALLTSGNLTLTAGNLVQTLGTFSQTYSTNALTHSITNNSATTIGNASSTGVVNIVSTSLSTGALVNLQLTEGTLNGGWFLRGWDATAGSASFSFAEDGLLTISGVAGGGSNSIVLTAGDFVSSDGSVAITDADNAASFTVTNNTATSASVVVIAGSGTFTGNTTSSFMTITPSGLNTGTGVYLPLAGLTQGKGLHITTGATQTTGSLLYVQSTGANCAITSGTVATFDETATAVTGTVNNIGSNVSITSNRTVTTGTVADDFDLCSLVRTSVINGGGSFSKVGSVLYVQNVTTNTSGTITDTTNGIEIVMDVDGTGDGISLTHNAVAGKALNITSAATTAAGVILATANALTSGQIINIASSSTGIATTGRMFLSAHTGATGTSAVLNEFSSAANDETVVLKVTASAALAAGVAFQVSGASVTTGTLMDVSDGNALTSGYLAKFASNSGDTTARSTVYVLQDHASASGATALEVKQDGALAAIKVTAAANTTNYFKIATMNGVTLWVGNGTTGQGNLSATAGDILFNGGTNKPEYCTGTNQWVALV